MFAVGLFGFYSVSAANSDSDSGSKVLEIYIADELHKRIPIPDELYTQTYSVATERGINTIQIKNGAVKMLEADCPDHLCELNHPISKLDEILVCMPNRVILTLVSE
ncbi:NusG domain II-containing protein [Paenibacillus marinisediminis]